ncbi:MAG: hypothetical protein A2046_07955 [Bacteroidetes bacterium GWA2_30_7]|nr:MAG: hypothetical protein A2046_07955 [Bacteroidetes bacterium GWA2_30_7]
MLKKLKNIISILLVLILLMPSIVKLEHSHEKFICNSKNLKHLHTFHQQCEVCNFEFSVFLSEKDDIALEKTELTDSYTNCYTALNLPNLSKYTFLLRAPPVI